jgi:Virulence factor BrkB
MYAGAIIRRNLAPLQGVCSGASCCGGAICIERLSRQANKLRQRVGHFGNYDATYGSLGAAIGMMTWMWISMIVVLLGAELNAEIKRKTNPAS